MNHFLANLLPPSSFSIALLPCVPTRVFGPFRDAYCSTKARAEQLVIETGKGKRKLASSPFPFCRRSTEPSRPSFADKTNNLTTVCIRPHGIFGQHDVQMMPRVIASARAGKTKYTIGDGRYGSSPCFFLPWHPLNTVLSQLACSNEVDFTFVGNVVHGHLLAAQAAPAKCNAEVFFITNDEPVPFWSFMTQVWDVQHVPSAPLPCDPTPPSASSAQILVNMGYPRPYIRMPYKFVLGISYLVQLLCSCRRANITFTPSVVQLAGTHHWYSCEKVRCRVPRVRLQATCT